MPNKGWLFVCMPAIVFGTKPRNQTVWLTYQVDALIEQILMVCVPPFIIYPQIINSLLKNEKALKSFIKMFFQK